MRKPARQDFPTRPRNCRSELIPIAACATASATRSASVVSAGRPLRGGDPMLVSEHIRCNDKGFQTRHLELLLEETQVWRPFFIRRRVPANPPTFTSSL
jgi:hypothetical protein